VSPTAPQPTAETPAVAPAPAPAAPHQALYRRWRAQRFSEIVGQTAVVETLRNAVRTDRVAHAILFVGPRGTGKTSLARILAKALNCTNLQDGDPCDTCEACVAIREGRAFDLVEIDAASNRGIGDIRDLRERIHYAPTDLRRKVYILDEAHQITKDAWNALLKSLVEPPPFVAFMFASTHPQEFPPAILSRLQRYDVRRLSLDEIEGKLRRILEAEGVAAEPGAVHLIARLAAGGMRDAESILDQVLASATGAVDEATVRDLLGLADVDAITTLTRALVDADTSAGLAVLAELDERGRDVAVVLDQLVEQIRTDLAEAIGPSGDLARAARLAATAHRLASIDPERRGAGGLRLQVELALVEAAAGRPSASPRAAAPAAIDAAHAATTPKAAPPPEPETPDRHASVPAPAREAPTSAGPKPEPKRAREPVAVGPAPTAAGPADKPEPADKPAVEPESQAATPESHAPAPAATAPAPADPAGEDATAQLRAAWPEIVVILSQNPPVKPLIAACRPVSVDGAVVTLGFPEDQAFLKDALERRRPLLEDGIGRVLGRPVNVRCVATNLDQVPEVATPDAADLIAEARRIFADDLVDVGEVS
jgi:DNA polymerase-3 subunit gamma/tau